MDNQLLLTAQRIAELRSISGKTVEEMCVITGVTFEEYEALDCRRLFVCRGE